MTDKTIEINSFNPYDSIFPNRKIVNRDTLILIKTLRADGYKVIVTPDDNRHVEYLFKKGASSFLSDPLNLLIITVPVTILTNLISNYIQKTIDKTSNNKKGSNIIIIDNSTNFVINSYNKRITKKQVAKKKKKRKTINKNFSECLKTKSPFPGLPFPILLEHQPIIVGWCRLKTTDKGLETEKGIITDKTIYREMQEGKYKGGSVTGIAKKSICNICNSNYVDCNHIAGKKYNGTSCNNSIVELDFIELSVVKEPINTETFFKML